ncbi:hypothetical protein ACFPM0_28745 [Pseudonocardia sulfidoxydans]
MAWQGLLAGAGDPTDDGGSCGPCCRHPRGPARTWATGRARWVRL